MCEIIYAEKTNKRTFTELDVQRIHEYATLKGITNQDGYGILNDAMKLTRSGEGYHSKKTLPALRAAAKGSRWLVIHLRAATNGRVCHENSQPLPVGQLFLAHNGIFTSTRNSADLSDSRIFTKELAATYKANGDVVAALKSTIARHHGWYRLLIVNKRTGKRYWLSNDENFTAEYVKGENLVIGGTSYVPDSIEDIERIGDFQSDIDVSAFEFTPSANTIYRIDGVHWTPCASAHGRKTYQNAMGYNYGGYGGHDPDEQDELSYRELDRALSNNTSASACRIGGCTSNYRVRFDEYSGQWLCHKHYEMQVAYYGSR